MSSTYAYLAISAWADRQNLEGAAHWLRRQWREELGHATKLIDYMAGRDGAIVLTAIGEPRPEFASLLELFGVVLEQGKSVVFHRKLPVPPAIVYVRLRRAARDNTGVATVEPIPRRSEEILGSLIVIDAEGERWRALPAP